MYKYTLLISLICTAALATHEANLIDLFGNHGHRHITVAQRTLIAKTITQYEHCNLLIIGTGLDSGLWMDINENGTTYFIEHDPFWIDQCQKLFPGIQIIKTEYKTLATQWQELLNLQNYTNYLPPIHNNIINQPWDVILIDGPPSQDIALHCSPTIGRMQAFFLTRLLAINRKKMLHIFIHDTDRIAERVYAATLFGAKNFAQELENLWHYKLNA